MRTLYHLWLSPYSRKVRLALTEKGLDCELRIERVWERRPDFLAINPAGQVPVLVEPEGTVLIDSSPICEFLDEAYPDRPLIGPEPVARAETRRLVSWFDLKFGSEVTVNLVDEKVMRKIRGEGEPDSSVIRAGKHNIHYHLQYIGYLSERRTWLAGDDFSMADITAAAELLLNALRSRDAGSEVMYESLARVFLVKLVRKYGAERETEAAFSARFTAAHYKRVLDFIADNYGKAVAIEDIAREAGLSPSHFTRLFRETIGDTPYQFLMRYRVERAKEKLADPSLAMIDIALGCGFSDQPHFSRIFKQFAGLTPSAYRKAVRSE